MYHYIRMKIMEEHTPNFASEGILMHKLVEVSFQIYHLKIMPPKKHYCTNCTSLIFSCPQLFNCLRRKKKSEIQKGTSTGTFTQSLVKCLTIILNQPTIQGMIKWYKFNHRTTYCKVTTKLKENKSRSPIRLQQAETVKNIKESSSSFSAGMG